MLNRLLLVLDVVLVITAGALGAQLHRIWAAAPAAAAAPAPAPPAVAESTPASPAAKPVPPSPAAFAVIAERNLFAPTRSEAGPEPPKPPVMAMATPAARPAEKPRLYGVVIGADGGSRAYLWDPQTKKVFGYKVGDSVTEGRLETIDSDRVVIRRGSEVFEVLLRDPSKPKSAPVPTPAAPTAVSGASGTVPGSAPFVPPPQVPQTPQPTVPGALNVLGQPQLPRVADW